MKSSRLINILIVAGIIILILLLARRLKADDSYGSADYSSSDNYPTTGLVADWRPMVPERTGDLLQGTGSFEDWNGTTATCSGCPTGFTCTCVDGDGSAELDEETDLWYDFITDAEITMTGTTSSVDILYDTCFTDNLLQNLSGSVSAMKDSGTTNFIMYINEYSDAGCSSLIAATPFTAVLDITTAWVRYSGVMESASRDLTAKSYKVGLYEFGNGGFTTHIDKARVYSVGVLSSRNGYALTPYNDVGLDPECPDCVHRYHQGPAVSNGFYCDGVNDYLWNSVNEEVFDPANYGGNFSMGLELTPEVISGKIIGKRAGTPGYLVYTQTDKYYVVVRDAGGATGDFIIGAYVDSRADFILSFETTSTTKGSNVVNMRCGGTTTTENTQSGIGNSPGPFTVCSRSNGAADFFNGTIHRLAWWGKTLSAIDLSKWTWPHYPGTKYIEQDGMYGTTCTQAASHSMCGYSGCHTVNPHSCKAEMTGNLAMFGQGTEEMDNNSFELNAGTQLSPAFTGYSLTESAGDGTAEITAYYADTMHGDISLRSKLTGTTSNTEINTTCLVAGVGSDVHVSFKHKCLSGKCTKNGRIMKFSGGACASGYIGATWIISGEYSNNNWSTVGGLMSAADWGATVSYLVRIEEVGDDGVDSLMDTLSIKAASYRTPWTNCSSGSGTCTYTTRDHRLHNPLADYIQEEDAYAWSDGFCIAAWIYSDWPGDDSTHHEIFFVDGTAGDNNRWEIFKNAGNGLHLAFYDAAGAVRFWSIDGLTETKWTAGDWKYIEICADNNNGFASHLYNVANSTWYNGVNGGGGGTGIMDGQLDSLVVGSINGSSSLDGYIHSFSIEPYNAGYTYKNFNNGIAPPNPY